MKRLFILVFALSTMTLMAQTPINIIIGSKAFSATNEWLEPVSNEQ